MKSLSGVVCAIAAAIAVPCGVSIGTARAADSTTTIGLVLTRWSVATYETPGAKDECPDGFHYTSKDNWLVQFPTEEQRAEFTRTHVHLVPTTPAGALPETYLQARGPQGSHVVYNAALVKDPLPLREAQSKVAYGMNLDGTSDGQPTAKSCRHQKFVGPDGESGIDNQLYRVLACAPGWRKKGFKDGFYNNEFRTYALNRVLIEISNVHDERNDDHVEVTVYKGLDGILFDAADKPIPWLTQRADTRFPQYISRTRGKIVDGVLETEPVDAKFSRRVVGVEGERLLRRMRLQLKLTDMGAVGQIAGYEDLDIWWNMYSKPWEKTVESVGLWSPPAMYEGVHRLADGYPDPHTGQCNAISSSYRIDAVRAFIIRPSKDDPIFSRLPGKRSLPPATIALSRDAVRSP
jgi:hypothetical protein